MAYKDFTLKHNEQLLNESQKDKKEIIELREKLNEKENKLIEKDNLIHDQNVRLSNYDDIASEAQKSGGSVVGLMNKFRKPQVE